MTKEGGGETFSRLGYEIVFQQNLHLYVVTLRRKKKSAINDFFSFFFFLQ